MEFKQYFGISLSRLFLALNQSLYMISIALLIGTLIGIPVGILLILSKNKGIMENKTIYVLTNYIVNIVRAIPFVILLIFIMPLTRSIVGTTIGSNAAIVPLVCYIVPFIARLVEGALLDVDPGIIEAAQAMGATTPQIIWHFLLPEALSSLILALTTGTIGLIGASAMAGAVGGGGIGDLALTYGYQSMNTPLMILTVIILVILVLSVQSLGNALANRIRNHS